ncbi:hypothetical protein CRUP_005607, partial [Coryphaenoides rupestris]
IHDKLKLYEKQSPAPVLHSASCLAEDMASSWLTTCRMSPRRKGSPASWQGVALSSKGNRRHGFGSLTLTSAPEAPGISSAIFLRLMPRDVQTGLWTVADMPWS